MQALIVFLISNFTLTFFILSLIAIAIALIAADKPLTKAQTIDTIFRYSLLFNLGLAFFYNFIMHVFFGDIAAEFIGWSQSPFQAEVGFASLGFSIVGILAFWRGIGFRAATVIAPAFFLWGAAAGHIYQLIQYQNFAPGNIGVIFWTDVLIPLLLFILLYLQYKYPTNRQQ